VILKKIEVTDWTDLQDLRNGDKLLVRLTQGILSVVTITNTDGENQLILNHPETNGFLSIIFADDFSESYLITEGYPVPKPLKEGVN
jgi:hypothetical protein